MSGNALFLCSCSNRKLAGGESAYRPANSMPLAILRRRPDLIEARQKAFSRIQGDATSVQGTSLRDLPYNAALVLGPDFGGKDNGRYMPAMARYRGRFFMELDPDERGVLGESPHRWIIVSALYGLLALDEPIQLYSCHTEDDADIAGIWKKDGLLTSLLLEYTRVFNVRLIVDLMAEESYHRLFNWERIKNRVEVLRAFGDQNAGPALLPALGFLARDRLLQAPAEDMFGIEKDRTYHTDYEDVVLTRSYREPPVPFINEPDDHPDVQISIRNELDGRVDTFGSRFWSVAKERCRPLEEQLDRGDPLGKVSYSDRYINTPWSLLLIREILLALMRNGQADSETALRVFTRDLRPDPDARVLHDGRSIRDSWRDNDARKSFFMEAFKEGRGGLRWGGTLKIETGAAPHFRELRLDWTSGVAWTLKLDQGVGYWRCGSFPDFPFGGTLSDQMESFNGVTRQCKVTSQRNHPTYIYVAKA